jgi:Zn-dependent metalloprotease
MNYLDLLQWPAMVATVVAAWLVASRSAHKRAAGFWVFLLSNVLWVVWGFHDHAYALIALQVCLAALNMRGVRKNE